MPSSRRYGTLSGVTANTARHTEVERKFDVLESTVSPSFDGLTMVARVERLPSYVLDAVYYDTPKRDLAARRVTLRRRTGGPDQGWHLKLPAGPGARTEVRAPLGAAVDEVPAELRDIVLAIVRNRPLAPVARITTNRTVENLYDADGAVIAEFCDDDVRAWAQGGEDEQRWREWEIELAEGAGDDGPTLLDRLTNRLLDAGAVPAGHGSKLARVLANAQPEAAE
ncbi:CYTH domain-containing protein, partial [Mycolicibacterium elephantis]